MLWLSRKDIEHISRRLLRDYLKKVPQKVDHIDPADFAEKMCGLQFTFADISEAHDAIGLTATSGVIITIPQRDGTRLDYELDGKTAFIDQSLVAENQIGRLNFTMMHEAAHQLFWMLYPEEYEAQTPRCVFRMTDEHTQYPVLDWEEWQTNVLTSFLLLPKELVYRHMANVGLKDGISVLNAKQISSPTGKAKWTRAAVDHLLSNGKYIAVIGMEKFMDAQFEKSARCNVDYDKEGTPRKGTRYVSPAVIQI